ncbi:hypothetical protein BDQ17DRAFT_765489 [Cyathus striatus]|nr:hypothetical protein BDQ17DRAFT_765489 [Cyathus striatus]
MSVHHGAGFDPSALAHISYLDSDSSNQTNQFHPCGNIKQSDPLDDATLGGLATSLLIGYLINWGLLGLLTSQVYTYYMGFPNDRRRLKLFVYSLYLIELAQTIMATRDAIVVYAQGLMNSKDMMNLMKDLMGKAANGTSLTDGAFGKDFCDFLLRKHLTINDVHLLWLTVPVTAGIVGFIGQIFFAYRLWVLSESVLLSALIVSLGSLATASALICGGRMLFLKKIMDGIRDPLFLVSCGLWNGFAALCDVIIAACMSYY